MLVFNLYFYSFLFSYPRWITFPGFWNWDVLRVTTTYCLSLCSVRGHSLNQSSSFHLLFPTTDCLQVYGHCFWLIFAWVLRNAYNESTSLSNSIILPDSLHWAPLLFSLHSSLPCGCALFGTCSGQIIVSFNESSLTSILRPVIPFFWTADDFSRDQICSICANYFDLVHADKWEVFFLRAKNAMVPKASASKAVAFLLSPYYTLLAYMIILVPIRYLYIARQKDFWWSHWAVTTFVKYDWHFYHFLIENVIVPQMKTTRQFYSLWFASFYLALSP